MDCVSEAQDIEKSLKGTRGIIAVESVYISHQTTVSYDADATNEPAIIERIRSMTGFTVQKKGVMTEPAKKQSFSQKIILPTGAVLLAAGLSLQFYGSAKGVATGLEILSLLILATPIVRKALARIKANPFNTDVLMSTAGIGSLLIGSYAEGAAVLLLFTLAELLESYTTDRVRKTAAKLAEMLPKRALVKRGMDSHEVAVEELAVGDVIVVKPGWRIPIDGNVTSGSSSIDQASVTGESVPVEKVVGDTVLSGTLNMDSTLEISVTKAFYDSTTSRIIDLVMDSQSRKASTEKFVDKFSRYYTPAMLVLAMLVATMPPLLLGGAWSEWTYRALIVIVIACPSAFLISTPVTVLFSLTAAMRSGVLIKGGVYIEELARIKAVIFDKTGTLTEGMPKVTNIDTFDGYGENELLRVTAALEASSSHPLAKAIVDHAAARGIPVISAEINETSGKGVRGKVDGHNIVVGKLEFLHESGVDLSEIAGLKSVDTLVGVAVDGVLSGVIQLADTLRVEARTAVEELNKLGIVHTAILTGDQETVAANIAGELGITDVYAGLLPEDKEQIARQIQKRYGATAMVGDGINDAPVLAASNIGIAMSTAGNDIALEAADVALMGGNLRTVPYIIRHGRKTASKLKANLVLALGLKVFMIVGGIAGIVPLWVAVLGDDGATLIIIANALPLLRHKLSVKPFA